MPPSWGSILLLAALTLSTECNAARWWEAAAQRLHLLRSPRAGTAGARLAAGWAVLDPRTGRLKFSAELPNNGAAPAYANVSEPGAHPSLFGQVRVTTNAAFDNDLQMQGAGFVEGYLTAPTIYNHWYNWRWWISTTQTNDTFKVMDWLEQHYTWVRSEVAEHAAQREELLGSGDTRRRDAALFWEAVGLALAQFEGLVAGYSARVTAEGAQLGIGFLTMGEWLLLNSMGDIDDLLEAIFPGDARVSPDWTALRPSEVTARLEERGKCSVLIKVAADLSDLWVSHATWYTYTSMTRYYKVYTLNLGGAHWRGRTTSMSSYPGMITSMDDFYILSSGLVVTETSNSILDKRLWKLVTPAAALSWQRVLAANWLSSSGAEWASWVAHHNSGTYNNQYMLVDLNRFKPGAELAPGLLTVVEQMPGLVVSGDMTGTLERGYWPSYNIPVFEEVYNRSGYRDLHARLAAAPGAEAAAAARSLSYQLAPRAQISRRDSGAVSSLASLQAYIRSNAFPSDPLSGGSAFGAVCSRGDLDPTKPRASGCLDAKVTSYALALNGTAEVCGAPTVGGGDASVPLPPFRWEGPWERVAHRGMPLEPRCAFERVGP